MQLGKVWGFHGGYCEECRLLGYKTQIRTSQETRCLRYKAQPVKAMEDLRTSRWWLWRMPSPGMWRRVTLVRTDVSEECTASIIKMQRISELGTLAATSSNFLVTVNVTPQLVLTKATRRHIPDDGIFLNLQLVSEKIWANFGQTRSNSWLAIEHFVQELSYKPQCRTFEHWWSNLIFFFN
jgi:hypothetical protein